MSSPQQKRHRLQGANPLEARLKSLWEQAWDRSASTTMETLMMTYSEISRKMDAERDEGDT